MLVIDVKKQYPNRRYVLRKGMFDPENKNVIYVGYLKESSYDLCRVEKFYVFDDHKVKTVSIYISDEISKPKRNAMNSLIASWG